MKTRPFGRLASGASVELYTLSNAAGATLEVMTYGGIVRALQMPDRQGSFTDIVLGFDSLEPYLARHPYFGAIVGRIAGRVTSGILPIEGETYHLPLTDGRNHLHGGKVGLDRRVWVAEKVARADGVDSLRLTYRSPDGEEGYPGAIEIAVTYTLTADHRFIIESEATADRVTPLCLAHHSYFNLGGEGSGAATDHEVQIFAESWVPTDDAFTLSGQRERLSGQGPDFREPRRLAVVLPSLFKAHGGLYPLRAPGAEASPVSTLAARVVDPASGRVLEVYTNDFCLQFYTASGFDGSLVGKSGHHYLRHAGLCFECQGYPDAARWPDFGDIMVKPDRPQRRQTIYAFATT